jgi:urease accessory protein UreE
VQDGTAYVMAQNPEAVLVVDPGADRTQWARVAWMLGNLHLPVDVTEQGLRLADDPAARLRMTQLGLTFRVEQAVFQPPRSTPHAGHGPGHEHT